MTLKECIPASSTLLYHPAIARRAASFMVFFENTILKEWHKPYVFLMSGYSSNIVLPPFVSASLSIYQLI